MADLMIIVEVENNKTISHFSIPPSGKLVFKNGAEAGDLMIEPKSPTKKLPFCQSNGKTEKKFLPLGPDSEEPYWICNNITDSFYYSATIGQADAEDPIVIIEKPKALSLTPLTAALIAAGISAAVTYLIVRSRDSRKRPQQG